MLVIADDKATIDGIRKGVVYALEHAVRDPEGVGIYARQCDMSVLKQRFTVEVVLCEEKESIVNDSDLPKEIIRVRYKGHR